MRRRSTKLQRIFTGALEQANNMRTRTQAIRRALVDSPADVKLMDQALQFDRRVLAVLRALRGDETLRGNESGSPTTIQNRVNSAVQGSRGLTRRADRHAADELHDRERRSHRAGRVAADARSGVAEVRAATGSGGSALHARPLARTGLKTCSWQLAGHRLAVELNVSSFS